MSAVSFDRTRMQPVHYENLTTGRGSARFTSLVLDYMKYLRHNNSDPSYQCGQDDFTLAEAFLKMVNTDYAWPLAQQVTSEFKASSSDLLSVRDPLKYVLESVQERLPTIPPPSRVSRLLELQENLLWQKMKALVEYLAYGSAGADQATPTRKMEVDVTLTQLAQMHNQSLYEELRAAESKISELECKLEAQEQEVGKLNKEIEHLTGRQ